MRTWRRSTAVLAASLAAHALLLTAWLSRRTLTDYAEPPPIQVELLRPQRVRPAPAPKPPHAAQQAPAPSASAAPLLSQPASPAAPALPAAPRPTDPPRMTDQELLDHAGPRPDLPKLYEEEAKRPVFSRRLPPGPFDCKPADEHSDRIAPPCPAFARGGPSAPLPNRPDVAGEARRKDVLKAYKDSYGSTGMAKPEDYPGLRCTLLHTHC